MSSHWHTDSCTKPKCLLGQIFKSMMFWESNNLEISVFESRVVRLRTGKIALNTFKNIHQQSNIFESSKEGTGWWRVPAMCATSSGVAGGLGTLCGMCPQQASGRRLPSWPQCLWPSLNKGKGRLVLPSVKSNLGWVHFEAGPAGGRDSSLVLPGRVPFLLSNFSVFGFLQEKVLAASLTNIPISFYKRTLNSSVAKRKTAFHTLLLFASFHRWSEERSRVSQRCVLLQAAQGDQTLFQEVRSYFSFEHKVLWLVQILPDPAAPTAGWGRLGGALCPVPAKGSPELWLGFHYQ